MDEKHQPQAKVSKAIFSSPNLSRQCFYHAEKPGQEEIVLYLCWKTLRDKERKITCLFHLLKSKLTLLASSLLRQIVLLLCFYGNELQK